MTLPILSIFFLIFSSRFYISSFLLFSCFSSILIYCSYNFTDSILSCSYFASIFSFSCWLKTMIFNISYFSLTFFAFISSFSFMSSSCNFKTYFFSSCNCSCCYTIFLSLVSARRLSYSCFYKIACICFIFSFF